MSNLEQLELWFVTGSQHLYGEDVLKQVAEHSRIIVNAVHSAESMPVKVVLKPVVKTGDEIYSVCQEANGSKECMGVILWMHTFSPAKMWLGGLRILHKPFVHLHTQFNRDIPWDT